MQKKKTKNLIRAIVFVLIFAIISYSLTGIFMSKWYSKNAESAIAEHFYELKDDSIEVLLLGSSQVAWSIDSVRFYEKYGISTYSFGGSHNNFLLNYYWLQEILKTQRKIKTVMIDMSVLFNDDVEVGPDYLKNLQGMKWSETKVNAIRDYYNKIDTEETETLSFYEVMTNYFFTLNQYHSRWDDLDEPDFNVDKFDVHNVMGYTPMPGVWKHGSLYEEFIIDNDTEDASDTYKPVQEEYLKKIIDLCRKNDMNVVLIKTPKRSWTKTASDYVAKFAEKEGIDFLECTTDKAMKDIGIVYDRDFRDPDHLNIRGAQKLSDYYCKYLLSHGEYYDAREKKVIDKKSLDIYHKNVDNCYLNTAVEIDDYFKWLKKRDYTIILQSSGDISEHWTPELQKKIESLGFKLDISQLKGKNYITAVKNGKLVLEMADKGAQEASLRVIPSVKVKLVSKFSETVTKPTRDKELKFGQNGMRISVFDEETGEVVSRATLYYLTDSVQLRLEYIV